MEGVRGVNLDVTAGSGPCQVHLTLSTTQGRGLCGFLTGGTAHVGGVAYAVPRPKSSGEGLTADVSTICGPGHKDVYAAQTVAKQLCLATGETVCICAGLHLDHASGAQIKEMMDNCAWAARQAAQAYQKMGGQ